MRRTGIAIAVVADPVACPRRRRLREERQDSLLDPVQRLSRAMLYSAIAFLGVGLVAGVLRLTGIAAAAGRAAWILLPIGAILVVIYVVAGRRVPPLS